MARIRSIRPEFWKSETIKSLPFRERLTFIGLWSYVDDNGVGIDNYKLIAGEIYGLEDDPIEAREHVQECLASLAARNLIIRYTLGGRRLIFVTNWDEHQRVDRPSKPRYPRPEAVPPAETQVETETPFDTRETLARVSMLEKGRRGEVRELRPTVLAENRTSDFVESVADPLWAETPVAGAPAHDDRPPTTVTRRSKLITDAYFEVEPMAKWPAVNAIVIKAIKVGRWPDDAIRDALLRMAADKRPVTVDSLRVELDGLPPPKQRQPTQALTERDGMMLSPRNVEAADRAVRIAAMQAQLDRQAIGGGSALQEGAVMPPHLNGERLAAPSR